MGARHDELELFLTTKKVATGVPGPTSTNLALSLSRYERCLDETLTAPRRCPLTKAFDEVVTISFDDRRRLYIPHVSADSSTPVLGYLRYKTSEPFIDTFGESNVLVK